MKKENQANQELALNAPELENINQAEELAVLTNINEIKMEKPVKQNPEQENRTTVNVASNIFTEGQVYSLSDNIYKIGIDVIESNRKEDKQIADKLKSCEKYGMQVPAVLVDSKIVQEAGYTLKSVIGTPEEHKPRFTAMEGNTRLYAFLRALEKAKNDSDYTAFDYRFLYKRFDDPQLFRDSYRNINICNVPTKTKDYVRDLLATGENKVLKSYQDKLKRKITAKAAGLATVNREIMKRDINSIFKGSAPDYITDESILEYTTPVYEGVLKFFGCETGEVKPILKNGSLWSFNADMFNKSKDKKEVSEKLVKLYNSMPPAIMSDILTAKKTANKTREQKIREILEKEYKKL